MDLPHVGLTFDHARYIIGSPKAGTARPDRCIVTRITKGTVYYHTETGMKMCVDRDKFSQSVKS